MVFAPNFAATTLGLKMADAQLGLFVANIVAAIGLPFAAALSGRIRRPATMIPAIVIYLVPVHILHGRLLAAPSNPAMWTAQGLVLVMLPRRGKRPVEAAGSELH
jgi:hypothetical protein